MNTNQLSGAIRSIEGSFAGLRFDQESDEEDISYITSLFEQIAERKGFDTDDLIDRLETAKEQLEEYRTFEDYSYTESVSSVLESPLHLMTGHRAKFEIVVILDTVEAIWPHRRTNDERDMEGERRLFYVAFTRARQRVIMLTESGAPLSPFVDELGLQA